MSAKVDKLVKLYKSLSKTPVLTGAKITNGKTVNTYWTQRNVEEGKFTKFTKSHLINSNLECIADTTPLDVTNQLLSATCPSEKYRAVIKEVSGGKEERKQFLEIWNKNFLTSSVDLTALDLHGIVYADVDFGSLEWSPDGTKVLYIAEKKLPKREPFYKRKADKKGTSAGDDENSPPATKGEEYMYRQEWGEQMVGKCQSVIAMYDIEKDSVRILEGIPEHMTPGQVIWSSDSLNVIGIVWDTLPRKLGIVYCTNRPSRIFSLDLTGNYSEISAEDRSVQGPKLTPDGKYLLWLEGNIGGPHRSAMALMRSEYPPKNSAKTIVQAVKTEITTVDGQLFYGLYNMKFQRRCWAKDNRRLVFSSTQKNEIRSYVLDIESGELTEMECDRGSLMIYDIVDDKIVASEKNYLHTDKVLVGMLPEKGNERHIQWNVIQNVGNTPGLEGYTYHYMNISHDNEDAVRDFNAIYFGPKSGDEKTVPLIVWPHGGPHSSYFNGFSLESSLFASLGFAMLFVNYRGSLGAGQNNVEYLLGRVGDADVKDCVLAAQEACKQFAWLNPDKLVLNGGSHGGFLVHHLSGQYPDMFKAVLSRNPVIDISTMSLVSDIPDWCSVEAGSEYTQKGPVNHDLFVAMRKASPIQHVHKVKAPTFLMIGSKDLRVPASQGIEFYNRLKANNIPVKMNLYDDNHPLGAVPNEMDNLINGVLWFLEHTA